MLDENKAMLDAPIASPTYSTAEQLRERLATAFDAWKPTDGKKTKKELAERCEVLLGQPCTQQTVNAWFKTGRMDKKWIPVIAQVLGVDLLTGLHSAGTVARFDSNARFVESGKRPIPVISAVQAGLMTEVTDPYALGDGFDIEYGDSSWSVRTFALEIEGKSMLPEFREGDRVIIDPDLTARPGDFVVAKNSKEEATFKKYRVRGMNERGDQVFELVPLNEDFETMRSDLQPLRIIGVMVEHRKRYRRPTK